VPRTRARLDGVLVARWLGGYSCFWNEEEQGTLASWHSSPGVPSSLRYSYISIYSILVYFYLFDTCIFLSTRYLYISIYSILVYFYLLDTCIFLSTRYLYISIYSILVYLYLLDTCIFLSTRYLYIVFDTRLLMNLCTWQVWQHRRHGGSYSHGDTDRHGREGLPSAEDLIGPRRSRVHSRLRGHSRCHH